MSTVVVLILSHVAGNNTQLVQRHRLLTFAYSRNVDDIST